MHYALNCTSYNHVYRLPTSRSLKTDCTNALMMYFRSWQVDHDQIYTSIYQPSGSSIICSLWVFHFWTANSVHVFIEKKSVISPSGSSDRKSWKVSEIQSSGMLSKVLPHQIAMALPPSGLLSTAVMRNGGYRCLVFLLVASATKQGSSCSTNVIVRIKSWRLPWPSTAML